MKVRLGLKNPTPVTGLVHSVTLFQLEPDAAGGRRLGFARSGSNFGPPGLISVVRTLRTWVRPPFRLFGLLRLFPLVLNSVDLVRNELSYLLSGQYCMMNLFN